MNYIISTNSGLFNEQVNNYQGVNDAELDAVRIEMEIEKESLYQIKRDLIKLKNEYSNLEKRYYGSKLPKSNKRYITGICSLDEYESNKVQRLEDNINNTQINTNNQLNKRNIEEINPPGDREKIKKLRSDDCVKITGFLKTTPVPTKLAKFIGVCPNTELTGPQVTKLVWSTLVSKGLQYENDRRVFRTNEEVSDIFGVHSSANDSTTHNDINGFNFCNFQKHIKIALEGN